MAEFIYKYNKNPIYISDETWPNHFKIFESCGLNTKKYRYFDKISNGLNFKGFIEDLENAPEGSHIVFHACGHNPTGVDPSYE